MTTVGEAKQSKGTARRILAAFLLHQIRSTLGKKRPIRRSRVKDSGPEITDSLLTLKRDFGLDWRGDSKKQ